MIKFSITGVVHRIGPVQTFNSGFQKQEVVLDITEEGKKYPNFAPLSFTRDKGGNRDRIQLAANLRVGDTVCVAFSIDGRESTYNGQTRFFASLTALSVEVLQKSAPAPIQGPAEHSSPESTGGDGGPDDLPF